MIRYPLQNDSRICYLSNELYDEMAALLNIHSEDLLIHGMRYFYDDCTVNVWFHFSKSTTSLYKYSTVSIA